MINRAAGRPAGDRPEEDGTTTGLSDKALGVFALAAYPRAIEGLGLARVGDYRAVSTEKGQAMVGRVLDAIRSAGP